MEGTDTVANTRNEARLSACQESPACCPELASSRGRSHDFSCSSRKSFGRGHAEHDMETVKRPDNDNALSGGASARNSHFQGFEDYPVLVQDQWVPDGKSGKEGLCWTDWASRRSEDVFVICQTGEPCMISCLVLYCKYCRLLWYMFAL